MFETKNILSGYTLADFRELLNKGPGIVSYLKNNSIGEALDLAVSLGYYYSQSLASVLTYSKINLFEEGQENNLTARNAGFTRLSGIDTDEPIYLYNNEDSVVEFTDCSFSSVVFPNIGEDTHCSGRFYKCTVQKLCFSFDPSSIEGQIQNLLHSDVVASKGFKGLKVSEIHMPRNFHLAKQWPQFFTFLQLAGLQGITEIGWAEDDNLGRFVV